MLIARRDERGIPLAAGEPTALNLSLPTFSPAGAYSPPHTLSEPGFRLTGDPDAFCGWRTTSPAPATRRCSLTRVKRVTQARVVASQVVLVAPLVLRD